MDLEQGQDDVFSKQIRAIYHSRKRRLDTAFEAAAVSRKRIKTAERIVGHARGVLEGLRAQEPGALRQPRQEDTDEPR